MTGAEDDDADEAFVTFIFLREPLAVVVVGDDDAFEPDCNAGQASIRAVRRRSNARCDPFTDGTAWNTTDAKV